MVLLEALDKLPGERWDALLVDEGQDFRPHWWPVLEDMLREPGRGGLYAFFDPRQDLFGGGPPPEPQCWRFRLLVDCSNTAHVARWWRNQVGATVEVQRRPPHLRGHAVVVSTERQRGPVDQKPGS